MREERRNFCLRRRKASNPVCCPVAVICVIARYRCTVDATNARALVIISRFMRTCLFVHTLTSTTERPWLISLQGLGGKGRVGADPSFDISLVRLVSPFSLLLRRTIRRHPAASILFRSFPLSSLARWNDLSLPVIPLQYAQQRSLRLYEVIEICCPNVLAMFPSIGRTEEATIQRVFLIRPRFDQCERVLRDSRTDRVRTSRDCLENTIEDVLKKGSNRGEHAK